MNYLQTLEEQATLLGYACTDSGKKAHVTGFSLINEILAAQAVAQPGVPSPLVNSLSDAAIAQLTAVMQSVSNTTFNEALPMIKNIMEKLQQVVNPDIPVAYSQHEIVPVIFSDLWDTPMVMEMAEKGKKVSLGNLEITGLIQSLDAEEYGDLLALAQTGLGQLDSEIRKVFGGKTEDELRTLFTGVFGSGYLPSQNPKDLMTSGTMDEWILIVLWCNKLYEMAPKQSAFSLERYRLGIIAIEQLAFSVVSAVDSQRRAFSDAGRLVVERIGKKVYVINDRYASFLKEGGSPESILGLLLTEPVGSNRNTTVEEIRKVQGQLEQAWNRHVQISSVTHTQQMAATARRQLHLIMEEVAKWHYGDDQGKVPADLQGQYVASRDKLASCIQALPEDFTRDAHRWVFDMVGKCFYEGTDVSRMLNNLREVGDSTDGELSAEEVKVIAAINFCGDWVADIIQTTDHGMGKMSALATREIGLEGLSGMPSNAKEWLQLLGLMILGAGVGYAIGTLLNKFLYGKSKADKANKAAEKLEEMGVKEVPIKDIVEKIKSDERFAEGVPRVFVDMIEQNSEWQKLVKSVSLFDPQPDKLIGMAHSLFERNWNAVDDRAAERLVHEANDLTEKLITSTNGMANAVHVLGLNVKVPSGNNATVDSLMAIVEGVGAWEEEFTGRMMAVVPVDRISTSGSLQVMNVVSDIKANAKAMEEGMDSVDSLMKSGNRRIDDESSKEAANYNDATKAAVARLGAAFKAWSRLASAYIDAAAVATNAGIGVAMIVHGIKDIDK